MESDRVVYLVSVNGIGNAGGVERVSYYTNEILKENKYNVKIIDRKIVDKLLIAKWVKKIFGKRYTLLYPILFSMYLNLITKKNDVIISNGFITPFCKTDLIFVHGTLQGYFNSVNKNEKLSLGMQLTILFEKYSYKNAKKNICVSQNAVEEIKRFYSVDREKIEILNNCVDTYVFFPENKEDTEIDNKIKVVFVGRLEKGKGIAKLLDLAEQIENLHSDIEIIIACNNTDNIDKFAGYKNVKIHQGLTIGEMNRFYNTGDILYLPSMYEGFEMVTLEALSAGIPVLGNAVGAIKELNARKFLGVYIVNNDDVITQIKYIANKFNKKAEKIQLHDAVKNEFDISVYKRKLNLIISSMIKSE